MNFTELKAHVTDAHDFLTAISERMTVTPADLEEHEQWRDMALDGIAELEATWPHAFCVNEWPVWGEEDHTDVREDVVEWIDANVRAGHWLGDVVDEFYVVAFADEREAIHFKLRWA